MPTKEQVWAAADRVWERGEKPVSQASVLEELRSARVEGELPPGGTQRTIAAHFLAWKVKRGYGRRAASDDLPPGVAVNLSRLGSAIWEGALAEALARLGDERRHCEETIRSVTEVLVEVAATADASAAEAANLMRRNQALETETQALRKRVEALELRLDHVRSEEFWDRVMQEAYEILPDTGSLTPAELMARFRRATLRAGRLQAEPLIEANLRKKMNVRVDNKRYFDRLGDDGFVRLADWDGRTGMLRTGKLA